MKKGAIILATTLASLASKENFANIKKHIEEDTNHHIVVDLSKNHSSKNTFYIDDDKILSNNDSIDHQTIISMNMDDIITQYGKIQGMEIIRQHFLEEINFLRTNNALPILRLDTLLNNSAQYHAEDMARNNYFSHINKKWEDWKIRIKNNGYRIHEKNVKTGEILSQWPVTIKNTLASFMDSAPHRSNILHADYFDIWIGEKNWIIVICFGWSYTSWY